MVRLLIVADAPPPAAVDHAFGGAPLVAAGSAFAWPMCRTCGGAMRHLGRLRLDDGRLVTLFMCGNRPGLCDEWDADAGGNRAVVVDGRDALIEATPPAGGATLRETRYGATVVEIDGDDYDEARDRWCRAHARPGRAVLGQFGGEPTWLQADETPTCDACGGPMSFVAMLEQGPSHEDEMNFGGGLAYVFACACPASGAKFLWQS